MSESGDDGPLSPEASLARAREHWACGEPCWFAGANAYNGEVWDFAIEVMKRSGYSDARLAEALMHRGCSPPQKALGHVAQALTTLHHLTALLEEKATKARPGRALADPMLDSEILREYLHRRAEKTTNGKRLTREKILAAMGRRYGLSVPGILSAKKRAEKLARDHGYEPNSMTNGLVLNALARAKAATHGGAVRQKKPRKISVPILDSDDRFCDYDE